MKRSTLAAAAVALGTIAGTTPAAASIEAFANYSGVGGANMYWQRTGTKYTGTAASMAAALATAGGNFFTISAPGNTTPGAVASRFTFLNPKLFALGQLDASYLFNAVASPGSIAQSAANYVFQPVMSGSFSFTYMGAADLHVLNHIYHTGANLLTATFAGGAITGQRGSTSGMATASTSVGGETITYTSDFIDFAKTRDQDLAISASSIARTLNFSPYQALNSFAATTTGLFSSDPLPRLTAAVPEPATWAMLAAGFGLVGLATRRGRTPLSA